MAKWKLIAGTDRQRTRCGKKPQYSEGLYDLGDKVYAWMVPNGSWGESNAGLVVGNGESSRRRFEGKYRYRVRRKTTRARTTAASSTRLM